MPAGPFRLNSYPTDIGTSITMLPRPPSAAPRLKSAYTQSAQYTHPSLFPIFRRAFTPRTEVIDAQVPHQTDGTLMRGVEGRTAVVLGRLPSPWRVERIFRLPLPGNTPHTKSTGSWTRVASWTDAHRAARLADARRPSAVLRATQSLPNGDPA